MGTLIGPPDCATGAALISSLLNEGFAYVVGTGGKLMALLHLHRSVLRLGPLAPRNPDSDSVSTKSQPSGGKLTSLILEDSREQGMKAEGECK